MKKLFLLSLLMLVAVNAPTFGMFRGALSAGTSRAMSVCTRNVALMAYAPKVLVAPISKVSSFDVTKSASQGTGKQNGPTEQEMERFFNVLQKDPLTALDLNQNASQKEFKRACQQQMKIYHPDCFKGDVQLREKAKQIAQHLLVIKDNDVNQFGKEWVEYQARMEKIREERIQHEAVCKENIAKIVDDLVERIAEQHELYKKNKALLRLTLDQEWQKKARIRGVEYVLEDMKRSQNEIINCFAQDDMKDYFQKAVQQEELIEKFAKFGAELKRSAEERAAKKWWFQRVWHDVLENLKLGRLLFFGNK